MEAIVSRLNQIEPLVPTDVAPELAEPRSFLKVLKARHYNWSSGRFRKVFGMRFSVKLPPLEQLNTIAYPRENYDVPVFIFFLLLTRRKAIAHLNLNCPFDDADYRQQWIAPLSSILSGYPPFDTDDRYPEWMKKYRHEATIYGLFPLDKLEHINSLCFAYLEHYTREVARAQPVTDPERLKRIAAFQSRWIDDIRTQDKAQGMMAKMIGKETAHRIFYEVTT